MKVKLKEAKIINSLIVWGELDYRGFASMGVKLPSSFSDFNLFDQLQSRTQVVWHRGELLLYFSINLNTVCPKKSIFNLTAKQLYLFCKDTYDAATTSLASSISEASKIVGQELIPMDEKELYFQLATFFNESDPHLFFDPSSCVVQSTVTDPILKFGKSGFLFNGVYQNIIRVDKFTENYKAIFDALYEYGLTINITEKGSEILVRITSDTEDETAEKSILAKGKIHSLRGTGYYESTSKQELLNDLQNSVPGWLWSNKQTYAKVIV